MSPTVRELLDQGQRQLRDAGIVNPQLAAEVMLRFLLKLRRIDVYLKDTVTVSPDDTDRFRQMIVRKLAHEPLQYIIGETEWFGLNIRCTPAALIPRPETEIIVERALDLIADTPEPLVADIGTGTGCIAIAIAQSRADAHIVATDISTDAIILARENISLHGVESRVILRPGNLLAPLDRGGSFDLIISNPPYVSETAYHTLMPEVRSHEPQLALVAGLEGLDVIRLLIADGHHYLKPSGLLVFEIGEEQGERIRELAGREDAWEFCETIKDYNDRDRGIVLAKR